ncbi:hypothetical protein D3C80_1896610 [compost metagenome]
MVNYIVTVNISIYSRPFQQCNGTSFGEEGHEAQVHTVLFFEFIFVLLTDAHDVCHVYFVESSQHCSGVFRFYQATRYCFTQVAHLLYFILTSE